MRALNLSWSLGFSLALAGCFGGGGGDGGGGGGGGGNVNVPADKPLDDLNAAQLQSLCQRNLANLKKVSSPNAECTAKAVASASDQSSCTAARSACLEDASSDEISCADLGGKGAAPDAGATGLVSCSVTPAELEKCLRDLVAWVDTLSCARIGEIEEAPSCWDEQNNACPELEDLLDNGSSVGVPGRDGGVSDFDAQTGDQECTPNQQGSCTCANGSIGVALCGADGFFGSCQCGTGPGVDGGVDAGPGLGDAGPSDEGPFYCGEVEYFFDLNPVCDSCGANACCGTYEACLVDADCSCFYFCTAGSIESCLVDCGLDDLPPGFYDHYDCLVASCDIECEL